MICQDERITHKAKPIASVARGCLRWVVGSVQPKHHLSTAQASRNEGMPGDSAGAGQLISDLYVPAVVTCRRARTAAGAWVANVTGADPMVRSATAESAPSAFVDSARR